MVYISWCPCKVSVSSIGFPVSMHPDLHDCFTEKFENRICDMEQCPRRQQAVHAAQWRASVHPQERQDHVRGDGPQARHSGHCVKVCLLLLLLLPSPPSYCDRCGMVWFSEDVLSTEMIFNNYLAKLRQLPLEGEDESFTGGRGEVARLLLSCISTLFSGPGGGLPHPRCSAGGRFHHSAVLRS